MMRSAQLAPLVIGTLAVLAVAVYLAVESPSPGALAAAHAGVEGMERLPGCQRCHTDEGLDQGCLSCHGEIADQLASRKGYHAYLIGDATPRCARCHPDHDGREFDVAGAVAWQEPEGFGHPHVTFDLGGAHADLACDACHGKPFALAGFPDHPRGKTFLGLSQTCIECHENPHGTERLAACTECHDQERFEPAARFDHGKHLSLREGHRGVACHDCHRLPQAHEGLRFGAVRGKACAECHETPHRTDWRQRCEACHTTDIAPWSRAVRAMTHEVHALTGFVLRPPHDAAACSGCHAPGSPYAQRFPVDRTEDDCAACHTDVHQGQFGHRSCLACHDRERFRPATHGRADHRAFPLRAAHARAECNACHRADPATGVRRFAGTPQQCRACHTDSHGGQFEGVDCSHCHGEERFLPARYDLARHDAFPLTGAHTAVSCRTCHRQDAALEARRFRGSPRQCRSCHADVHGGQFAREVKAKDCTACHRADATTFGIRPFDHAARTGYTLTGAHEKAACSQCHPQRPGKGVRDPVRTFRKTPTRCAACHTDAHRGQFGKQSCSRCHGSTAAWKPVEFDHDRRSRFPLDRRHRNVACDQCHPGVRQPDGNVVVQFKPLGTKCGDCHAFEEKR